MEPIERLLAIMARLRDPEHGCEWDRAQTFETIAPYTLEEAYEVDDAIRQGDLVALRDELGDLLLQVVFHARIAEEAGEFDFAAVATGLADKLVRRHPHVFEGASPGSPAPPRPSWEDLKAAERVSRSGSAGGPFEGVPLAAPALARAAKLRKRAARAGWSEGGSPAPLERALSTAAQEAVDSGRGPASVRRVIGELLEVCVRVAVAAGVDPELALREANDEFARRVHASLGFDEETR